MVLAVTCSGDAISNDYRTTIGIQVEDWESGDFTNFNWQFEGNAPWIINSSEAYEGQYCAKSGDISDGQESELFLYTEVLADGDVVSAAVLAARLQEGQEASVGPVVGQTRLVTRRHRGYIEDSPMDAVGADQRDAALGALQRLEPA